RRNRGLRAWLERHAEDRSTAARDQDIRREVWNVAGGSCDGDRRFVECEESRDHDEQENHATQSGAGFHGEPRDLDARNFCESLWTAGIDDACVGWVAVWDWVDHERGKSTCGVGDLDVVVTDVADRGDSERRHLRCRFFESR